MSQQYNIKIRDYSKYEHKYKRNYNKESSNKIIISVKYDAYSVENLHKTLPYLQIWGGGGGVSQSYNIEWDKITVG